MITITDRWLESLPKALVGVLVMRALDNPQTNTDLSDAAEKLAVRLQERFGEMDRPQLRQNPVLAAYDAFYRRFRKTYHVQLQLESVVFKGKPIQGPSTLVKAMLMAELETGLLTAVHDLDWVVPPLTADVAQGGETYIRINGREQALKDGDMFIKDQVGILSSVIYGPDQRTMIRPETNAAVFTTYGPPGIRADQINNQLTLITEYIRLFAQTAKQDEQFVLPD